MEKIASFQVSHNKLMPGIYVSRKDTFKGVNITTFDIRITRPNVEPVLGTSALHAIEHLGATYLRSNEEYKDRVVYFGPMGCRTGFYLILEGEYKSSDLLPLIIDLFTFINNYEGAMPGASADECGNYRDINLPMAKYIANNFLSTEMELEYPL